jgi:metal-sulfur cluster biosynthetic enzyme
VSATTATATAGAPTTGREVRRTTDGSVDEDRLLAALGTVEDPELPLTITELGLLREVEVRDGHVRVGITYTSLACPCVDMLREDVHDAVAALPDVRSVEVEDVLEAWSRDDVTPAGIELLRTVAVL